MLLKPNFGLCELLVPSCRDFMQTFASFLACQLQVSTLHEELGHAYGGKALSCAGLSTA